MGIAGLIVGTTLAASGATTLTSLTGSTSTTSGTLIVTGGVGVSGQVTAQTVKSMGDITTGGDVLMSKSAAAITHTGASLTVSSNTKVLIESVTFIAGAVSTVTSIGMSGDITTGGDVLMSKDESTITHTARGSGGSLTISSNRKVLIEDVTFTGSAITGAGAITSNGALTIGGALSGVTSLAASGATTLTANTGSTSTTSGTLIVTGGVGVSGQVTAQTVKSIGDITKEANVLMSNNAAAITHSGSTALTISSGVKVLIEY